MLTKPTPPNPELDALIAKAKAAPPMTEDEIEAQKASFVRGMMARCEHGVLDFEQCPKCRGW